jgi:UPF0271 protein
VLHEVEDVVEHVLRLAGDGVVRAIDGSLVPVKAESICLHGDTPGAVAMAAAVRSALVDAGIRIQSFA